MLPTLELLADGATRAVVPDITDAIAARYKLSDEDRAEKIPSGQRTLTNRTHWAITYLTQAGLISRPSRGRVQITAVGRQALDLKPSSINIKFLMSYPSFEAFRAKSKAKTTPAGAQLP